MSKFLHYNKILAILVRLKQFLEINYRLIVFVVVAFEKPAELCRGLVVMLDIEFMNFRKNQRTFEFHI